MNRVLTSMGMGIVLTRCECNNAVFEAIDGTMTQSEKQSETKLMEMGKAAQDALDRLIEQHPELKDTQEEIQDRLANAGTPDNRLAVLGIMIESKLQELQEQLSHLMVQKNQPPEP